MSQAMKMLCWCLIDWEIKGQLSLSSRLCIIMIQVFSIDYRGRCPFSISLYENKSFKRMGRSCDFSCKNFSDEGKPVNRIIVFWLQYKAIVES